VHVESGHEQAYVPPGFADLGPPPSDGMGGAGGDDDDAVPDLTGEESFGVYNGFGVGGGDGGSGWQNPFQAPPAGGGFNFAPRSSFGSPQEVAVGAPFVFGGVAGAGGFGAGAGAGLAFPAFGGSPGAPRRSPVPFGGSPGSFVHSAGSADFATLGAHGDGDSLANSSHNESGSLDEL
jgi:hypothetical protein